MRKFVHIANGPMLRTDLIKEIHFRDDAYIAVCEDGESRQLCPGFTLSDLRDPLPVVPAIAGVTAHCFHCDDDADVKEPPHTWQTSVIAWRIHDDGPEPILLDGCVPCFIAIEDRGRFVLSTGEGYDTLEEVAERYKELRQALLQAEADADANAAAVADDAEQEQTPTDDEHNDRTFPTRPTHRPGRTYH
jgi:hypothetical protein